MHAANIIEKCFEIDENFAIDVLKTPSKLYFNYKAIKLAEENGSYAFIGTKCVQKYLDRKWFGKINYSGYSRNSIAILVNKSFFKDKFLYFLLFRYFSYVFFQF